MRINIDNSMPGRPTGDLFGLFFEDLNHAGDGGLYAEMVQNRSFEFDPMDNESYHPLTAWEKVEYGASGVYLHVDMADPLNRNNLHYLVMEIPYPGEGAGIKNTGFGKGMAVKKDGEYNFSCFYSRSSSRAVPIEVRLENGLTGECLGKSEFMPAEKQWTKTELSLSSAADCDTAQLALICKEPLKLKLDMISLFPADTFKGRPGGLRRDIVELLRDMQPKFMRFPGGCLMHIGSLDAEDRNSMYRWKNTVGPVEERPARRNNWQYNQSFGLGFYELFQLCEDIGAEPLPVISAGYDPHSMRVTPMEDMQEWIDDAVDLIEFANGSADTKWGRLRASMGHEAPFNLKYLGIGNEEVGEEFFQRYELMCGEIKKSCPDIQLIGSGGPGCAGNQFDMGWETARRTDTAFVDEHFYQAPEWFVDNADRYADYSADGPRAFLGEYASCGDSYYNALSEAAFMIGMEKSPGMGLACYAPMLCHEDYVNWTPDMLWYDSKAAYGTASYYVQKLFMVNQGDNTLTATAEDLPKAENEPMLASGGAYLHSSHTNVIFENAVISSSKGEEIPLPVYYGGDEDEGRSKAAIINESSYEISFDVRRSSGKLYDDLEGRNAFSLAFGVHSPEERFEWRMNGWQRLTGITQIVNGRALSMQSNLHPIEIGESYHCRLIVKDEEIQAFINGELVGGGRTVRAKQEGVFYSAAQDKGVLIVKAVNLFGCGQNAEICWNGPECSTGRAEVIQLSGYLAEDKNSLENPDKIKPVTTETAAEGNRLEYNLPPLSLTVFRIPCGRK